MKSKLLFLFVMFALVTNAQTYSISPAKTVTFTAALNNITINDIYMSNTGNSKIQLKWERVSINLPSQWQYSMCDYQTCYSGIPVGPNTMDSVSIGGQGFLGLNIDPGTTPGSGVVKVFVYQNGFKPNGDTLTWHVNAGVAGFEELSGNDPVKIYPNPVSDKLYIKLGLINLVKASIKDVSEREVLKLSGNFTNGIDISSLPKGIYVVTLETPEKNLFKRIIKE